jgi:hypothetical protein
LTPLSLTLSILTLILNEVITPLFSDIKKQ